MEAGGHERRQGLKVRDFLQPKSSPPTLTLRIPARPEALGVVRLILMSCGAVAGIPVQEIFRRSQEVTDAFATILVEQPEVTNIVVHAQVGTTDVDLVMLKDPVAS